MYLRVLQGHSGRNLSDPSLQDNVIVQSNFFQDIYHVGCVFNSHSIIRSGLILGGQSSIRRQTVFFLLVDPMDKSRKDPNKIDLNARVMHNTLIKHGRNIRTRYIGRHQSCFEERIEILSNSIVMQSFFKKHFRLNVFESC